ncbi:MAG TPA: SHOCT domain-containing protein [Verrucomicrobiae bacterium]|nr:SHOCT domain-containing protein [Verrucomicrobiae bacterium]
MHPNEKQIWFRAKRYGWGWGWPCAWQGWVVFAVWLGLLCAAAFATLPGHFGAWIACVLVLAAGLFAICFAKGEKPRWRWGSEEEHGRDARATRTAEQAGRSVQPSTARPLAERLAELDDLRRRQIISESEYAAMRQKMLRNHGVCGEA